jgi:drug/metabolite transporter (DMT)-like permease
MPVKCRIPRRRGRHDKPLMHDANRKRALLLLIATAVLWSTGGLLIKSVDWNPLAISGMRSIIASVLILAYMRRPRFVWSSAQIGGAIAYAGTVILFVTATKLTTAANAILLQYTGPIWVAVFGKRFLGEKTTRLDWLMIGAVLIGMALFFLDGLSVGGLAGNIVAIGSGFAFGWFILFMRKQKDQSTLETPLLGNIIAAAIGIPFMFGGTPDLTGWAALVTLGVVQLGLSYILFAAAVKHASALDSILVPTIEPLLNPIWVFLLLGERPGPWALVGGVIVLVSVTARSVLMTRTGPAAPRTD